MKIEEKRKNTRNVNRLKVNLKLIITISATLIAIFYSAIKIFFIKENVEINNIKINHKSFLRDIEQDFKKYITELTSNEDLKRNFDSMFSVL